MNDPFAMRRLEPIEHIGGNSQHLILGQRPMLHQFLQRRAIEKLHGDEGVAVFFAYVVNSADIGVTQRRSGTRLAEEALPQCGVVSVLVGQELEGNKTLQTRVFRLIDNPHAALAELSEDVVMRYDLSDCQWARSIRASPRHTGGLAGYLG